MGLFRGLGEFESRLLYGLLVLLVCCSFPVASYLITGSVTLTVLSTFISAISVYPALKIALYASISQNKVRLSILTSMAIICIVAIYAATNGKYLSFINPVLKGLNWPQIAVASEISTNIIIICALFGYLVTAYLVINSLNRENAMGIPDTSLDDILPQRIDNVRRIESLVGQLRDHLNQLDRATQWNDTNYVSLQAQVQILEGRKSGPRIVEIIEALRRHDRTRVFLVLGEPGSGKSVSLRKLARDLLLETGTNKKIPVYVNLKEWRWGDGGESRSAPTAADLDGFVKSTLRSRLDIILDSFLFAESGNGSSVFQRLREAGTFYFIFDSFDEIPAVMESVDSSALIETVSNLLSNYLCAGIGGRGILASRLFRQPHITNDRRSIFELRPFTDERIMEVIDRSSVAGKKEIAEAVLAKRPDLGNMARNPLLLGLMIEHFRVAQTAPASQSEIFETYFRSCLG